jgi:hypothetical protein
MPTYGLTTVNAPDLISQAMLPKWRAMLAHDQELAKVARYLVRINPVAALQSRTTILQDLTFLCDSAELPSRSFLPLETRYYGPRQVTPGQSVYPDVTVSFLCRNKFIEREFFDEWANIINPPNTYDFAYPTTYQTTIEIFQFGEDGACNYAFRLEKAWPVSVNPQQVTWADDQAHRLGVQFAYTRWIPLGNESQNPNLKPSQGFEIVTQSGPRG